MAEQSTQDRRLPASQRKIARARESGSVPRSQDLGHLTSVLSIGCFVSLLGPLINDRLELLITKAYHFDAHILAGTGEITLCVQDMLGILVIWMVSLAAVTLLSSSGTALLSGGWNWTLQPLQPNFAKFNPITGFANLLTTKQMTNALKASSMALLLGVVGCWYLAQHWMDFVIAGQGSIPVAVSNLAHLIVRGVGSLLIVLALFALVDTPIQRHFYLADLKMDRQEAKEELRQMEGNMEVKGKVKSMMRQRARRRMLAAVPQADLVVMNPTHYAVALKYDEATMLAPRVVAKGLDLLALTIRKVATENDVPILEAPVLARALYAHAEVDREIPLVLYSAVAQVLAWVYQLRDALSGDRPMPGDLPDLAIPAELDPEQVKAEANFEPEDLE